MTDTARWQCNLCKKFYVIATLARDCELKHKLLDVKTNRKGNNEDE